MASNAERQAAWRARRDEELRGLRAVAGDARERPNAFVKACFAVATAAANHSRDVAQYLARLRLRPTSHV